MLDYNSVYKKFWGLFYAITTERICVTYLSIEFYINLSTWEASMQIFMHHSDIYAVWYFGLQEINLLLSFPMFDSLFLIRNPLKPIQ